MVASWLARTLGAVVATVALAACAASPNAGTGGFVSGDGSISVVPADQRRPAPVVEGETLGGEHWSSKDAAGKVLVYNVWGSWCAPCRAEAPDLEAAAEQRADKAVFMGLNTRDPDPAAPRQFLKNHGITYPSLFDPDGRLLLGFAGDLPPSAIPTTLLVDGQGRIAARILGATTTATLVGLIDDIAGGA